MESPAPLQVSRSFSFPAERVFDAWLNPALASKWLFATPAGRMVRAEVDARVGGRFFLTDRRDGEEVLHTGEYLEIERPRRLVFTFGVPKYSPDFVRVAVELEPAAGGCRLTLTQAGTAPEWVEKTREGWAQMLAALAAVLDHGERPGS